MKNWLYITLFLVLPIVNLSASNKDSLTSIHLTIVDSITNETIPFASVVVSYNDFVLQTGQTDVNGVLLLTWQSKYNAAQLTLRAVSTGYYDKVITGLNNNMRIVIKMKPPIVDRVISLPYSRPVVNNNADTGKHK